MDARLPIDGGPGSWQRLEPSSLSSLLPKIFSPNAHPYIIHFFGPLLYHVLSHPTASYISRGHLFTSNIFIICLAFALETTHPHPAKSGGTTQQQREKIYVYIFLKYIIRTLLTKTHAATSRLSLYTLCACLVVSSRVTWSGFPRLNLLKRKLYRNFFGYIE